MIVYLIKNIQSQKIYIGWTRRKFAARWQSHVSDSKLRTSIFANAIKSYGKDAFNYEILAEVNSEKEAKQLEQLWIITLRSYDINFGYNMTYGGEGGTPTELTRSRISLSLKGKVMTQTHKDNLALSLKKRASNPVIREKLLNQFHKGPLSTEHKIAIGNGVRGLFRSEEWRKNLSIALKGKQQSEEHRLKNSESKKGIKLLARTEEHRRKLSEALKGRKVSSEAIIKQKETIAKRTKEEKIEIAKKIWESRRKNKLSNE